VLLQEPLLDPHTLPLEFGEEHLMKELYRAVLWYIACSRKRKGESTINKHWDKILHGTKWDKRKETGRSNNTPFNKMGEQQLTERGKIGESKNNTPWDKMGQTKRNREKRQYTMQQNGQAAVHGAGISCRAPRSGPGETKLRHLQLILACSLSDS
jgi:hypothetical protein